MIFGRPALPPFRRERLELPDGDFLDLDWLDRGHGRLVVLCSGLEGNSRDAGMVRLALTFSEAGWDVLSWNYRGCGGSMNRLPRSYHSGATEDLAAVLHHSGNRPTALVGCSLGGNLLLKYLGEGGAAPFVIGAVAISPPVDLASSARALDELPANQIYRKRLIRSLSTKVLAKAAAMPGQIDTSGLRGLHGFAHFDDRFTAPMHGFRDAEDYWTHCSSKPVLPAIGVPTLILTARDDPFLLPPSFPEAEARSHPFLHLEIPDRGGHLGFVSGFPPDFCWAGRRAVQFLEAE
ncbi:MAG: alpha/beta fold hydrolase [Terrimicrobiaceae bacterium]